MLSLAASILAIPATGRGDVIGEYTTSGATVNAALVTGLAGAQKIVVSGPDLFVAEFGNGTVGGGTIGEYTTSGAPVNAALVSGLNLPVGIAVSGSNLFVTNAATVLDGNNGTIGEYTTSGATVNASLISGLVAPMAIAVVGSDLFVGDSNAAGSAGVIREYTTSGATVNASLITTNGRFPVGFAVSGSNLFVLFEGQNTVACSGTGCNGVAEYTTSGATVNANLITLGGVPGDIAVSGSNLFIADNGIAEYTTSGASPTLLVPNLEPRGVAVSGSNLFVTGPLVGGVPEPSTAVLLAAGLGCLSVVRQRMRTSG